MTHAYIGRLAPSPTGLLHLGHAATFWQAFLRAREHNGTLLLRNEDLDPHRSKPEFVEAMLEDLAWLGIAWRPPMLYSVATPPIYTATRSTNCSQQATSTPALAAAKTSPA